MNNNNSLTFDSSSVSSSINYINRCISKLGAAQSNFSAAKAPSKFPQKALVTKLPAQVGQIIGNLSGTRFHIDSLVRMFEQIEQQNKTDIEKLFGSTPEINESKKFLHLHSPDQNNFYDVKMHNEKRFSNKLGINQFSDDSNEITLFCHGSESDLIVMNTQSGGNWSVQGKTAIEEHFDEVFGNII